MSSSATTTWAADSASSRRPNSIGKVSFSPEQIRDNAAAFINTLIKLKPAAAKGTYIKSIYLSSTMSKGIKVDPKSIEA